jgi:prepilin-type N-terminal cleavage/methylation domain-containing protein
MKRTGTEMPGRAFTLIELLIVVAIIAILALIAVPNFLEAQARAKVSRAMSDLRTLHVGASAYMVDWGYIFPDANDSFTPPSRNGWDWYDENPGGSPDMEFLGGNWMATFYSLWIWSHITTPIAYVTFRPIQGGFSHNVPYGIDTREVNNGIAYWVILCGGPDRDNGDWYRGNNPNSMALPYDPTNGTVSSGDIWRGEPLEDSNLFRTEYGPWPMVAKF